MSIKFADVSLDAQSEQWTLNIFPQQFPLFEEKTVHCVRRVSHSFSDYSDCPFSQ